MKFAQHKAPPTLHNKSLLPPPMQMVLTLYPSAEARIVPKAHPHRREKEKWKVARDQPHRARSFLSSLQYNCRKRKN